MNRLLAGFLICSLVLCGYAQKSATDPGEFIVLRTDRIVVSTGDSNHLNCFINGTGDAAQINCESHSSGGVPLIYHVALVVGSNQVGYIVACGGGLIWRIGCKPLSTGQILKGVVHGDKLALTLDGKAKTYRIETSAYIGSLTRKTATGSSSDSTTSEEARTAPSVKLAVETSSKAQSTPAEGSPTDSSANVAEVMFSSVPKGADIYVDGNFVGNTPSQMQLEAGTHRIRIESKGQKPWTRELSLTAGGKVTIQATFDSEH